MINDLPFSDDGEKGVICSLLRALGEVFELCKYRLPSKAFYIPAYAIIYEVIQELKDPSHRVDFIWLKNQLIKRKQLEECGEQRR